MSKDCAEVRILPKSISADICRAGGSEEGITAESIRSGLAHLDLIGSQETLLLYEDLGEWRRGGGETYISDFRIVVDGIDSAKTERHLIAKAIISFTDVDAKWHEWEDRMARLHDFGVLTPKIFGFWEGVVFQQFIPHDFRDFFQSCSSDVRRVLKNNLITTAQRVDEAGFFVTGFIHNLRTDGKSIYVIDVGQDLGHYSDSQRESPAVTAVQEWLQKLAET